MKRIYAHLIIPFLFVACNKEDNFIEYKDVNHDWCGTTLIVCSFEGVLTDSTSGNSVDGFTLYKKYANSGYQLIDSIEDSTYLITLPGDYIGIDSAYNEKWNQIQIRNINNIIVDSFTIPAAIWVAKDTVNYNYSF